MDSAPNIPDFEYTILDHKGRRGIKDGKEYLITEEEYRKNNPFHKDTDCKECIFAPTDEDIILYYVPRELKESIGTDPVFIGKFCLPFMLSHLNYYIFRCNFCSEVVVSYLYGGGRRLWCPTCRDYIRLDPVRHGDLLIKSGMSEEMLEYYIRKDGIRARKNFEQYKGLTFIFFIVMLAYYYLKILN